MREIRGGRVNVGSLFSGIGGIELGFEREGFKIKWCIEYNQYCGLVKGHAGEHFKLVK